MRAVNMTRGSVTQTRAFSYGNPPGAYLLSAVNPENGMVTYTYNGDGTLASKGLTQYSYDAYKRVTQIRHYTSPGWRTRSSR